MGNFSVGRIYKYGLIIFLNIFSKYLFKSTNYLINIYWHVSIMSQGTVVNSYWVQQWIFMAFDFYFSIALYRENNMLTKRQWSVTEVLTRINGYTQEKISYFGERGKTSQRGHHLNWVWKDELIFNTQFWRGDDMRR